MLPTTMATKLGQTILAICISLSMVVKAARCKQDQQISSLQSKPDYCMYFLADFPQWERNSLFNWELIYPSLRLQKVSFITIRRR
jgi:hypothetical protein